MKLMHLSDLHLGKRVNGFSQIPDQVHILYEILAVVQNQAPDAVLICGDVYDKSVPSAEAVELFDSFLSQLAGLGPDVFIISGNHDSAERIAFGGRLFAASRVYVSPVYDGTVTTIEKSDEFGPVQFHLLPFIKPAHVRPHFPEANITSYTDAVRSALGGIDLADGKRHVLLTHQTVTGAERSESEELSIGGTDNVDAEIFAGFDYVALGHLHRPQNVGTPSIRYCGTPLKYSFSESAHQKSVTIAELRHKGDLTVTAIPLAPLRDMKELKGTYAELTARDFYAGTDYPSCYLHITLTDEDDIPEALGKLRAIYPYIMKLSYDNTRTRLQQNPLETAAQPESSPLELFELLYEKQNNQPMTDEQAEFVRRLMEKIWEV